MPRLRLFAILCFDSQERREAPRLVYRLDTRGAGLYRRQPVTVPPVPCHLRFTRQRHPPRQVTLPPPDPFCHSPSQRVVEVAALDQWLAMLYPRVEHQAVLAVVVVVVGPLVVHPYHPFRDAVRLLRQPAVFIVAVDIVRIFRDAVTRGLLLFVILTACRSGEARAMEWCEIDFKRKIWTIPAGRMKGGVRHRVPLSKQALELLEQMRGLHETLVFPSPRKQTVLSDMVLTSFLRKTKAISDTQGRFAVAHGFRSSFRDWCSEQRYPHDLAERALAHTIRNKSEAAYHRTDLLNERRPMMQAWEDYVMSAVSKT